MSRAKKTGTSRKHIRCQPKAHKCLTRLHFMMHYPTIHQHRTSQGRPGRLCSFKRDPSGGCHVSEPRGTHGTKWVPTCHGKTRKVSLVVTWRVGSWESKKSKPPTGRGSLCSPFNTSLRENSLLKLAQKLTFKFIKSTKTRRIGIPERLTRNFHRPREAIGKLIPGPRAQAPC